MNPRPYFYISGTIFGVIGTLHLLRAVFGIPVYAGDWEFPFLFSWPGGVVGLLLCAWAYRLARAAA